MKKIKYTDKYGEECWTDENGILLMCELFKGSYYMWEGYIAAINDMNSKHEFRTSYIYKESQIRKWLLHRFSYRMSI